MGFANRVNLQGYLEIERVEVVTLDGLEVPVIHACLYSGKLLGKHRLLMTNLIAQRVLEALRKKTVTSLRMVDEDGTERPLDSRPLVAIEGRLLTQGRESVVDVKWITFLSLVPKDIPLDMRLSRIIACWPKLEEAQRERIYALVGRCLEGAD